MEGRKCITFTHLLEVDVLLGSIIVPTTFPEVPTRIILDGVTTAATTVSSSAVTTTSTALPPPAAPPPI